jgi:hypothetical protein
MSIAILGFSSHKYGQHFSILFMVHVPADVLRIGQILTTSSGQFTLRINLKGEII